MAYISIKIKSYLKGTKLGEYYRRRKWNQGILSVENAKKKIAQFKGDLPADQIEKMVEDILDAAKKYRFSADEYFYYHFDERPEHIRKEFISDLNRIDFCETLNKSKNLAIFNDKMKSFEVFGKYYGRECCCVKNKKDFKELKKFISKHKKFILKPISDSCGMGIQIIDASAVGDIDEYFEILFKEYCAGMKDGFIVEELIKQSPDTQQFNPDSVNTIRVATVKYDDEVAVIAAFFRTGRKGSIVDNAGAGGVFGTIDITTGTITAAADEFGVLYTGHPDSGLDMVGFTIPRWQEAVELAKELATIVKGNRYAGWDLALTEKGWVMVEGNARGQFVWQIPLQKGFMKEANNILERLGLPQMTNTQIR